MSLVEAFLLDGCFVRVEEDQCRMAGRRIYEGLADHAHGDAGLRLAECEEEHHLAGDRGKEVADSRTSDSYMDLEYQKGMDVSDAAQEQ